AAPSPRGTWQAILVARSSVLNLVMRLAPDLPASRATQLSSTPQASGVTRPRPVTTTRRMRWKSGVGFIDVFDRVADRHNGFGGIIGNLDAELFFERHHQLDGVEAVGAQIFNEGRIVGDLVGIDIQMLDDDLLHAFRSIAHGL